MTQMLRNAWNQIFAKSSNGNEHGFSNEKINPNNPEDRKRIIEGAVKKTIEQYGPALDKLGSE